MADESTVLRAKLQFSFDFASQGGMAQNRFSDLAMFTFEKVR
jgi:hypothetical protein